jgi:hypothetical protein
MRRRTHFRRLSGAGLAVLVVVAGCGRSDPEPPTGHAAPIEGPSGFARTIDGAATWSHLVRLQEIADAHNGTRASGTTGYDASVEYFAGLLTARGFSVREQDFEFERNRVESAHVFGGDIEISSRPIDSSLGTGPDGVTAAVIPLARSDDDDRSFGCRAEDYAGIDVRQAIVLLDRGTCTFATKERIAADQGAAAMLVVNNRDGLTPANRGDRSPARIPMALIGREGGEWLRETSRQVTLQVNAQQTIIASRNLLAETNTGSSDEVVLVGAHLDSVAAGPGINDNGSGSAAVLATALAMGPDPEISNKVRFVFFGAEEDGLIGSEDYVESLSEAELGSIALMLSIDMVGSPNPGYFVYDPTTEDSMRAPRGSSAITRAFVDYYASRGIATEPIPFDGRSDYAPFIDADVPVGGTFTGGDETKSDDQAREWGGEGDEPFDPNYHRPGDTIDNIDRDALMTNTEALAYVVMLYAQSIDRHYAVPGRTKREAR